MKPLFFLWIQKTGGTTLHNAVKDWFVNPYQDDWASKELPQEHDYYTGHTNAQWIDELPENCYKVTMLRDPVKRVISFYNYHHHYGFFDGEKTVYPLEDMSFSEFIECGDYDHQIDNFQTGILGGGIREAFSLLKSFELFGILELKTLGLQYVVNQLASVYGKPAPILRPMNASPQYVTYSMLSHHIQVELHERNQLDLMLYEAAQSLILNGVKA